VMLNMGSGAVLFDIDTAALFEGFQCDYIQIIKQVTGLPMPLDRIRKRRKRIIFYVAFLEIFSIKVAVSQKVAIAVFSQP
jgi:hypothetical protein